MYFRTLEICLETYKHDSACFFTAPGLTWQAVYNRTRDNWIYLTVLIYY